MSRRKSRAVRFGSAGIDFLIAVIRLITLPFRLAERKRKIDQKERLDQLRGDKILIDMDNARVRGEKLHADVNTQNERTILVSNQAVLTDLKVEKLRRELGSTPWHPD